jgi:hypothetical protein
MADSTPPQASSPTCDLAPGESPGGTTITVDIAAAAQSSTTPISLRSPIKYHSKLPSSTSFKAPALEWLEGTWSVTHSTLPMWRKAKNVRITYKIIPPKSPSDPVLLDDEVASEPTERTLMPQPKSIRGVDMPDGEGSWNWRGRGWLKIATSHWELLGWGERGDERWVVTWFAPSMFTPAGLDIYSSKKEGLSDNLYQEILQALEGLEAKEMADLVKAEMKPVKIEY